MLNASWNRWVLRARWKDKLESTVQTDGGRLFHMSDHTSELGASSLYRGCSGRSGAELPMRVGWPKHDVSQVSWTATIKSLMHQSYNFEGDAVLNRQPVRLSELLWCWIGSQDQTWDGWRHSVHIEVALMWYLCYMQNPLVSLPTTGLVAVSSMGSVSFLIFFKDCLLSITVTHIGSGW